MLDYEKLHFPLVLRKWQSGDEFCPLGMKGKKKLSDFFIDQKMSVNEKSNQWLLCSGSDVVWVVGRRIDDRYKISENTQTVYKISKMSD
jgi:tRNA(Ile)-lysidine synthase